LAAAGDETHEGDEDEVEERQHIGRSYRVVRARIGVSDPHGQSIKQLGV
jgi:hypothetical protein